MSQVELCMMSAVELAERIRRRELGVCEVVEAHLRQTERVNPTVNAICTLVGEQAMAQARAQDAALANGVEPGPLCGVPVAHKDLALTKGIRTTFGSPIHKDFVPDTDDLFVQRLHAAGAVTVGKTNTPEFGAGSHTFNPVFGATRNPYDLARCAGGSSGGAAAALRCGMVPIADGSDMGGSLRNPGSFNNVVGLRPSPGRVPRYPSDQPWNTLSVLGPMGRTVSDVALMLSVMAGPDARDPISISESPVVYRQPLEHDFRQTRLAWSPDLGQLPVEPSVIEVIEAVLPTFEEIGCTIEPAHPDFSGARDVFQVLRANDFAAGHAEDLEKHRELLKDTVVWNTEQGLALSALDVSRAEAERAALFHRVHNFFERFDFLLLPVSQVLPFPVETDWVREINGIEMPTYVDWMLSCGFITLTGHPAVSMPCGFSPEGLPVGVQIVGRHRGELELLRLAYAFEQQTQCAGHWPETALVSEGQARS